MLYDNVVSTGGITSSVFQLLSFSLLFGMCFTAWGQENFAFYVCVMCLCTWAIDIHMQFKWES
jgi:hypothetical protein